MKTSFVVRAGPVEGLIFRTGELAGAHQYSYPSTTTRRKDTSWWFMYSLTDAMPRTVLCRTYMTCIPNSLPGCAMRASTNEKNNPTVSNAITPLPIPDIGTAVISNPMRNILQPTQGISQEALLPVSPIQMDGWKAGSFISPPRWCV